MVTFIPIPVLGSLGRDPACRGARTLRPLGSHERHRDERSVGGLVESGRGSGLGGDTQRRTRTRSRPDGSLGDGAVAPSRQRANTLRCLPRSASPALEEFDHAVVSRDKPSDTNLTCRLALST